MQTFTSTTQDLRRIFWLTLLIIASVAFTFAFACAVPFAAFAAATALTLPRRDALVLMLGVWLANQLTGFMFMNYPLDANTLAWGAALGVTALVSMFAARITTARLKHVQPFLRGAVAFLVAFTAYEISCYTFALMLGGVEDFTLAIQSRIFALNAAAFVGLFALNRLGSSLQLMPVYNSRMLRV